MIKKLQSIEPNIADLAKSQKKFPTSDLQAI